MTPPIRPKHRPLEPGGAAVEKFPAAARPHFEHPLARVPASELNVARRRAWRRYVGLAFEYACMASTWTGLIVVTILLVGVVWQAAGRLDWSFLANYDSRHPDQAGIRAGLAGSIWLVSLTALFAVPIGVGAAVYLEEYASDNWFTRLIRLNLSNLAGVPSIVYGILGLTVFVRMFGLFGRDGKTLELLGFLEIPLPFGRTVLAGALTLSLLVLPIVMIATQEALRAVPSSIRHASLALGATRWQTIRHQVLPAAVPGIATGVILALSRAMGETAPLVMIGAATYLSFSPGGIDSPLAVLRDPGALADAPFDTFTAIPIQIFYWAGHANPGFQQAAAAGILVLLVLLLLANATAIYVRNRNRGRLPW